MDKNKKLFLIIVPTIGNMGGAQMFAANKLSYYQSKGWDTCIYYAKYYPIIIDNLKKFESFRDERIVISPLAYSLEEQEDIISRIVPNYKEYDEILIESHTGISALWGELLAKRIGARHIINVLDEGVYHPSGGIASFYVYKLLRGEWMNQNPGVIKRFFGKYYKESYEEFNFNMNPYCSNVTAHIQSPVEIATDAEYTILSIGRINKPYILPVTSEIEEFCRLSDKIINVIYIGNSPNENDRINIENQFKDLKNVNLYMLGYMLPIPIDLIKQADVSIGSSNSVLVSYNLGIPTIAIDATDHKAIGVYGENTMNRVFREYESPIPVKVLLEDVLLKKNYVKKEVTDNDQEDLNKAFSPQYKFVENIVSGLEYYDINKAVSPLRKKLLRIKRLVKDRLKTSLK